MITINADNQRLRSHNAKLVNALAELVTHATAIVKLSRANPKLRHPLITAIENAEKLVKS